MDTKNTHKTSRGKRQQYLTSQGGRQVLRYPGGMGPSWGARAQRAAHVAQAESCTKLGGTPGGSADFQVLLNTSARAPAAVVAEVTAVFLS